MNPIWILIAIFLGLFLVAKFREEKQKIFGTIIILLMVVLFFSASHVVKQEGINFSDSEALNHFMKSYMVWLGQAVGNIREITGSAIRQEWTLNNTSIDYLPEGEENQKLANNQTSK